MLKQIKLILLFISLASMPFAASAGIFSNPYNHYYIDVGGGAYYLQHPKFEVGTKGVGSPATNTTAPLAKININQATPQFHLAVGYWFMNCSQNWITKIFGHEEAMEVDSNGFIYRNTVRKDNLGTGNIWYIDGSQGISGTGDPIPLNNFKLSSRAFDINSGVYFKGKLYTSNQRLTLIPSVGVVNHYYLNTYRYDVSYNQGDNNRVDEERFVVFTYYYGVALGAKLNYAIIDQIIPFASLKVNLLNIYSSLEANQDTGQNITVNVNSSESTFNYEAIAALGVEYKFTKSLKSPSLIVQAGVDHMNYVARVVPPNRAGDKPVHLEGESTNNSFAMLDLHIPFG